MLNSLQVGDCLDLNVESLTSDGSGLGRYESLVVFVADTCPGDLAKVELTELKKNFARGRLTELITPSDLRTEPVCEVFDSCGGCSWQHVQMPVQLEQKRKIVEQAFRSTGLKSYLDQIQPVIASPQEYEYRNRIQLHCQDGRVGYMARGSHEIVSIDRCPIADSRISDKIDSLKSQKGTYELALKASGEVHIRSRSEPGVLDFSQVNDGVNQLIFDFVRERITCRSLNVDLYSGNGNFSLPLAEQNPDCEFHLVELNREAIALAAETAPANARCIHGDVAKHLNKYFHLHDATVIVDPPRAGLGKEVVKSLVRLEPAELVYISCDPATLARDLQQFAQSDYRLEYIQPFDMFPQTPHVETVVGIRK